MQLAEPIFPLVVGQHTQIRRRGFKGENRAGPAGSFGHQQGDQPYIRADIEQTIPGMNERGEPIQDVRFVLVQVVRQKSGMHTDPGSVEPFYRRDDRIRRFTPAVNQRFRGLVHSGDMRS